jgi:hypothetical protein
VPSESIHDFKSLERAQELDDFTGESVASLFDMRLGAVVWRREARSLMSIFMMKKGVLRESTHYLRSYEVLAFALECLASEVMSSLPAGLRGGGRWAGARTKKSAATDLGGEGLRRGATLD